MIPAATQISGSSAAMPPPCSARSAGRRLMNGFISGHLPSRTFA
jgi:hypothetical protein